MRPSRLAVWLFAFVAPLFGLAVCATGQSAPLASNGSVQGFVRDSTGQALEGADVRIVDQPSATAISDEHGRYAIRNLQPGTYVIVARRVGFRPDIAEVTLESRMAVDVDFELARQPQELEAVVVQERALVPPQYRFTTRYDAFFMHRATAVSGVFLDRADIERYGGPARALTRVAGVKATENMGALAVTFTRCTAGAAPAV